METRQKSNRYVEMSNDRPDPKRLVSFTVEDMKSCVQGSLLGWLNRGLTVINAPPRYIQIKNITSYPVHVYTLITLSERSGTCCIQRDQANSSESTGTKICGSWLVNPKALFPIIEIMLFQILKSDMRLTLTKELSGRWVDRSQD